jgi:hypothetical protein
MRSGGSGPGGRLGPSIAGLLAALLVLAACGEDGRPGASEPIVLDGRQDGFLLLLRIGSDTVDAGAPIDISATLTWDGPAPRATVWGSGSGVVSFVIQQLDGTIAVGGAMTADCRAHDFDRLVPVTIPFAKSGGYSEDDPNADFYRTFYADPVLRLPSGRWKVSAETIGYLRPCEMNAPLLDIKLSAEILIR